MAASMRRNSAVNSSDLGVPCLRRAAAVEEYGEQQEQEVEADEQGEGWLTADQFAAGQTAAGMTVTNQEAFEEIPSIGASGGGGSGFVADATSAGASGSAGGAAGG
ncbi:hypothetical protein ACK3TF_003263 [Chlorella vulgaris]